MFAYSLYIIIDQISLIATVQSRGMSLSIHYARFTIKNITFYVYTFDRTNKYVQNPATLSVVMNEGVQMDW